jgi:hypothetical protein
MMTAIHDINQLTCRVHVPYAEFGLPKWPQKNLSKKKTEYFSARNDVVTVMIVIIIINNCK